MNREMVEKIEKMRGLSQRLAVLSSVWIEMRFCSAGDLYSRSVDGQQTKSMPGAQGRILFDKGK